MITVGELEGWPPSVSGLAYGRGSTFVIHADRVTIAEVVRITGKHVDFDCTFEAAVLPYSFSARNEKTMGKLGAILKNKGKSLIFIGTVEIPED